jgi:acyl-CoA thioesterase FadM
LGKPYRERAGKSIFVVETHITYEREVSVNEEVKVATQPLDSTSRIRCMWHPKRTPDGAADHIAALDR